VRVRHSDRSQALESTRYGRGALRCRAQGGRVEPDAGGSGAAGADQGPVAVRRRPVSTLTGAFLFFQRAICWPDRKLGRIFSP